MKPTARAIVTLAFLMAAAAGVLGVLDQLTRPRFEANQAAERDRAIRELTGSTGPFAEGDVVLCDTGVAVVRKQTRGYGGTMRLLVAVAADGDIRGVRVPVHQETPGFADILDPDDWLGEFGRREPITVDVVTGATITATAVKASVVEAEAKGPTLLGTCTAADQP